MELLLNDLSIHEQFNDVAEFREAVGRISNMRRVARSFGRELYCHWNVVNRQVSPNLSMNQGIRNLTREQQSALRNWLTKRGPFWEDIRQHRPADYLECDGEIVTDTAVGEAAYRAISGIDRQLISFAPSSWQYSPVPVTLVTDGRIKTEVPNWWEETDLANALERAEPPITTWKQLEAISVARYQRLTFSKDSFAPLDGRPFVHAAAYRIISLLNTLDRFMGCVDESGRRTPEGNQILQDHFTGGNAWFTDSSDTEKSDFRNQLTFPHPDMPGSDLVCTWHGKVRTEVIRLHFSWPVPTGQPLYVVYVGPKITKI